MREHIEHLEDRRFQAMLDGSTALLEELLDPSLVYIHATGTVHNKQTYLEYLESGTVRYLEFRRTDVQIQVFHESAALVSGRLRFSVELGGLLKEIDSLYTDIWVRSETGWRMVCWQATPVPPKPA